MAADGAPLVHPLGRHVALVAAVDDAPRGALAAACTGEVAHPFPAAGVQENAAAGPRSNTDQKGSRTRVTAPGALVDYLTVVLSETAVEEFGVTRIDVLLRKLFGFQGEVVATAIRERRWQFYTHSCALIDRAGEMVGKIGLGGNRGTWCVSLSGAGTKWVKNWHATQMALTQLNARISRCDLAFDDYDGSIFDVHDMRARATRNEFRQGGTPPKWRFLDDGGHNTGCTLYVGTKGHKELCIYEKGKQLKDPESRWVRCEVRLYGKHGEIPHSVLTDPLAFLRGAYDVLEMLLADIARDACTRIKSERAQVEATGEALVRYLRRQVGPSLHLLLEAFGGSFEDFLHARVVREGTPGRFRGIAQGVQLAELLRKQLCQSAS